MRLVAFIDLVVRRVWAKRGLLVGSFVGATLVTALVVVVPLYEASVQSVDLRFTLNAARSTDVDLFAFASQDDYSIELADRFRSVIDQAREQRVGEWYPTLNERVRSRTFVVIPTGPEFVTDWVAEGEAWKEERERLIDEDGDLAVIPNPPYPVKPIEATTFRVLTGPDIVGRVGVVEGAWPGEITRAPDDAGPIPVVLGIDLARLIRRDVGDRFIIKPFPSPPDQFELVEVAAIVEPVESDDLFWGLDDPSASAYFDLESFETLTTSLTVAPETDPWFRAQRGFAGLPATQRFSAQFDRDSLQLEEVPRARNALGGMSVSLAQETSGALIASTPIIGVLDRFDVRSVVIGAPILAMLALVVGGALYFLIFTAALSLEREGPELALLRSRGASSSQTIGIHISQSLVVAILAALVAPVVARLLIAVTGTVPPLADLTGGALLDVTQTQSLLPHMIVGGAVTFVSMGMAILPFARKRVLELRSLAARPTQTSIWQRYNLDLFAIALSIVLLAQLVQRGFIIRDGAEVTLDPLAVAFPVLLLFTGALLLLRLLPLLLRLAGWIMTRSRGLSLALPGWHLGRNPVPYGRLALLVWLTAGFGAFALTYASTLDTSFEDRAAFASGSDLRIVQDQAGFLIPPEGLRTAAVYRTAGGPLRTSSRPAELIAVQPADFAEVVAWRADFGDGSPQEIFAKLRPEGPPDVGVELDPLATTLRLEGLVVPRTLRTQTIRDDLPSQSLRWMVKVFDARGRVWTYQSKSDLVDTEWGTVDVVLAEPLNTLEGEVEPPLVIHAMWAERSGRVTGDGDPNVNNQERVLIADIVQVTPVGERSITSRVLEELVPENGLILRPSVAADFGVQEYYADLPDDMDPPGAAELATSPFAHDGTAALWSLPLRTRVSRDIPQLRKPNPPLFAIVDSTVITNSGLVIGEPAVFGIDATQLRGAIVGQVEETPTLVDPTRQGFAIVDFAALSVALNGPATWTFRESPARITAPQELWVATDDTDAALRQLAVQPDNAVLTTRAGAAADIAGRPVQIGLVAILFVGAATSVALALAGVTSYVILAVTRRTREMGVLRALGFPRRGVAVTFAAEQVVVLGLGSVIGTLGGVGLTWAMLPFLQLGETAREIRPRVALDIPWGVLIGYVAVVGLLMIASVVWATRRVSARRMSEVLREVDR